MPNPVQLGTVTEEDTRLLFVVRHMHTPERICDLFVGWRRIASKIFPDVIHQAQRSGLP